MRPLSLSYENLTLRQLLYFFCVSVTVCFRGQDRINVLRAFRGLALIRG